jgi:hypothetical protein
MKKESIQVKWNANDKEMSQRNHLVNLFHQCPIPDSELCSNLPLFINRQNLSTILFMVELYKRIISVHGIVTEFGVRWGRNMALFESLRGIFEPFNHNRKLVGFDTFAGFPSIHQKDGTDKIIAKGSYAVTKEYEQYLSQILDYHETESPISHIKKYELRKGDAVVEVNKYLKEHPETIIALAYFDFDIYEPTKKCLEAIRPHLTKGSVIGFDELNHAAYPGETLALKEVLGLDQYKIHHSPFSPTQSFLVIE